MDGPCLPGRKISASPAVAQALDNVAYLLAKARTIPGLEHVKVVTQLYVDGSVYTGVNTWAKAGATTGTGDDIARSFANLFGMARPSNGKIPWSPFLQHAEGHALLQALFDGAKGGHAKLFVSEMPCANCWRNFNVMKEMLEAQTLEVWYIAEEGIPRLFNTY